MAKILLVDDAKELLVFLSALLTMKDHEVKTASSINEMNSQLALFIPDLILLDVWLNDENTRGVCKEIKANELYRNIPVILLSSDPELLKDYEQCDADDILQKPFDINNVVDMIKKFLM
jgi:DNA-binding response OmpR family regulator